MNEPDVLTDLTAVASLADPLRRTLYERVSGSAEPMSRDEAAAAVGVSRQVAAYHLDRLVDDGLLQADFRRLSGRSGPGAGRPSKLYRRSSRTHEVSIPPRRYQLAAGILLAAAREGGVDGETLEAAARRAGRALAATGLEEALAATGYEPVTEDGETCFRNCPFHALREQDVELTCGLNLALVEGMVEGSGAATTAVLAPAEGYCCVRLRPPVG